MLTGSHLWLTVLVSIMPQASKRMLNGWQQSHYIVVQKITGNRCLGNCDAVLLLNMGISE